MLIATIPVIDYVTAKRHLFELADRADGVELRLDYVDNWDIQQIKELRQASTVPVILTLRNQAHGGHYPHSETQRLQAMTELCKLNPDYLDLEYDVPPQYIQTIRRLYPAIKIILSYHNFQETPADLANLFQSIYQPDCYAYKIATQAHSSLDALRMLHCVSSLSHQYRIIGLCMGEFGQFTRILAPVVGSLLTYACWEPSQATAPGQLILEDLTHIYHYRQLNRQTKIYAVLGDPINLSVGHILHNQALCFLQRNGVYVKIRLQPEELPEGLHLIRQLPFWGLSVTMPLKEVVLPLLDVIDTDAQAIQAVNTAVRSPQCWLGTNTDGLGAIEALAAHLVVNEQIIVILGAGGAARAIAYMALRRGAKVIILNRSLDKAKRLADDLGCEAYSLEVFPTLKSYTLVINTLPEKVYQDPVLQSLWTTNHILPGIVAMDIVYQPLETTFLRIAKAAGCVCIVGVEMYIGQALLQIQHWFQPKEAELQVIRGMMEKFFRLPSRGIAHCISDQGLCMKK